MNYLRMIVVCMALATVFCVVACDSRPSDGNADLSLEKIKKLVPYGCIKNEVRMILGEPEIEGVPRRESWWYEVAGGYARLAFREHLLCDLIFYGTRGGRSGELHHLDLRTFVYVKGSLVQAPRNMLDEGKRWMLSQQGNFDTLSVESLAQAVFVYSACGIERTHKRYGLLVADLLQRMCAALTENGSFGNDRASSRDAICTLSLVYAYNVSGEQDLISSIQRAVLRIQDQQMANGAWAETADDDLRGVADARASLHSWRVLHALKNLKKVDINVDINIDAAIERVEQWFQKTAQSHLTRRFPLKYNERTGEASGDGDVEAAYILIQTLPNEGIVERYTERLHQKLANKKRYISPWRHFLIAAIFFHIRDQDTSWRLWQATTRHNICRYLESGDHEARSFFKYSKSRRHARTQKDFNESISRRALFLQTRLLYDDDEIGPELELRPMYTCSICEDPSY